MEKRYIFLWIFIALIIILILFNIIFATKEYNLSDKFGISGNVIDYGVYKNEEKLISEFTKIYAEKLKEGKKIYLVSGNQKEIKVTSYDELYYGKINLVLENKNQNINIGENKYSLTKIIPQNNHVEVLINGKNYKFELKKDENVYFIISEDINN